MKVILRSPALPLLVLGILLKLPVSKVGSKAGREARSSRVPPKPFENRNGTDTEPRPSGSG
jgi:hypothetical protein